MQHDDTDWQAYEREREYLRGRLTGKIRRKPDPLPSPDEIVDHCEQIQSTWSLAERMKRDQRMSLDEYVAKTPQIRLADLGMES